MSPKSYCNVIVAICAVFLLFFCISAGCSGGSKTVDTSGPTTAPTAPLTEGIQPTPTPAATTQDTVRIGAFNIQVFGQTKASEPEVMDTLAKIIRTYDVVGVQEIRDSSGTALPALVDAVNADGSQYAYLVSERLGRTTSKEQYAFVYDTQTVTLSGAQTYPEPAGTDPFHREPFLVQMDAGDFDAVLAVIHTDPDEATDEINSLDDVYTYAATQYSGEDGILVMGDFNADGSYFKEDGSCTIKNGDFVWLIGNSVDTTTSSTDCTYDRIVITDGIEQYFTGDAGVFRFDTAYGLTDEETKAVSDHYPVYATFVASGGAASVIVTETATPAPTTVVKTTTATPKPTTKAPTPTVTAASGVYVSGLSLSDEWVKITNRGSSSVSLTGWKIQDEEAKHTYTFPSFSLAAGATVTLHTGDGTNTATELYWGSGRPIWNNDGDTASLYNANGKLVDSLKK